MAGRFLLLGHRRVLDPKGWRGTDYVGPGEDHFRERNPITWREGVLGVRFFSSLQFSSVFQSCPTLCDPMNCSMPGLPVQHQLLEFTQTHVHQVGNAIQPSHPLPFPSPPAPIPPSIRVFSNEPTLRMKWPKYWSFSLSIIPSQFPICRLLPA